MLDKQQTLKSSICFSGKGLHTGANVNMTVLPAPADYGIVFRRVDIEGAEEIPALSDFVVDTSRGTTIEKDGNRVATIEHILSALWTLGVDNAIVEIDGPETPIMDGSAREYAEAIMATGLEDLNAQRKYFVVGEKKHY
ncbi:MAG: UDP-3-O-acyl-N-acetylglucosamine deacetylase, partial [Rikenellaceae bacterium]